MGLAYPTVCLYQSEQEETQEPPMDLPPSSTYDETPAEVTVEELSTGKETWLSHTPQKLTVLGLVHRRGPNKSEQSKLADCRQAICQDLPALFCKSAQAEKAYG